MQTNEKIDKSIHYLKERNVTHNGLATIMELILEAENTNIEQDGLSELIDLFEPFTLSIQYGNVNKAYPACLAPKILFYRFIQVESDYKRFKEMNPDILLQQLYDINVKLHDVYAKKINEIIKKDI